MPLKGKIQHLLPQQKKIFFFFAGFFFAHRLTNALVTEALALLTNVTRLNSTSFRLTKAPHLNAFFFFAAFFFVLVWCVTFVRNKNSYMFFSTEKRAEVIAANPEVNEEACYSFFFVTFSFYVFTPKRSENQIKSKTKHRRKNMEAKKLLIMFWAVALTTFSEGGQLAKSNLLVPTQPPSFESKVSLK